MTTTTAMPTVTCPTTGVTLPVPPGWEQVDAPGCTLALAGPPRQAARNGTEMRASVVVTAHPHADGTSTDVHALGHAALAAATLDPGSLPIAYDVLPLPRALGSRRLIVSATQGTLPVEITQVLAVTDRHALSITATRPVGDLGDPSATTSTVLGGIELGEGA
ncbi:hypothetical protein J4G33_06275 [Actinotalea sp. BY-33]|uniref:Uncharacterized protein n=1 Tax=Actinotalea soli TaxID=2819234 RepID=A0A939RVR3_9CELL|nr:hypothetical protein [Actinotalea soli]MBO1751406.1 hypothetical protein [Actinotalea soli]